MKTKQAFKLPSGTIVPANSELHFSNEGQGFFNGESVELKRIPIAALEGKTFKTYGDVYDALSNNREIRIEERGDYVLFKSTDSPSGSDVEVRVYDDGDLDRSDTTIRIDDTYGDDGFRKSTPTELYAILLG